MQHSAWRAVRATTKSKKSLPQAGDEIPSRPQSRRQRSGRKFKEVQKAYDTLSDKEKRAMLDHYGHAAFGAGMGGGAGDSAVLVGSAAQGFFRPSSAKCSGGGGAAVSQTIKARVAGRRGNHVGRCQRHQKHQHPDLRRMRCLPRQRRKPGTSVIDVRPVRFGCVIVRLLIFQMLSDLPEHGKEIKDPCVKCRGEGRTQNQQNR